MRLSVDVDVDIAAADDQLQRLFDGLDDGRGVLGFLAEEMASYEREVFATAGFGSWAALDPDTVEAKGNGRVLIDTGNLLAAFTRPSRAVIAGESVTLATDLVQAIMLKRGARGMPVRDPAPVPPATTVRDWGEGLLDAILTGRIR